jgi:Uma2 family endonuclease
MLQTKPRFQNFEDYLAYDDGTDYLYELFNGVLIEVPPESGLNVGIAGFLFIQFAAILGHLRVRGHGLELEVRGEPRNRFPDLTIIREEHIQQLSRRNTIRLSMAPPLLVVEVVSPGELQQNRDYVAKRSQYQDLGIPEYWLIDPPQQQITILELQNGVYVEAGLFQNQDAILSPNFPELKLTAEQILTSGE